ncbi:MAG: hypothetical protein AAGI53_04550 [Planctomycetota bacterium]
MGDGPSRARPREAIREFGPDPEPTLPNSVRLEIKTLCDVAVVEAVKPHRKESPIGLVLERGHRVVERTVYVLAAITTNSIKETVGPLRIRALGCFQPLEKAVFIDNRMLDHALEQREKVLLALDVDAAPGQSVVQASAYSSENITRIKKAAQRATELGPDVTPDERAVSSNRFGHRGPIAATNALE